MTDQKETALDDEPMPLIFSVTWPVWFPVIITGWCAGVFWAFLRGGFLIGLDSVLSWKGKV